ncbi:MAG: alginate O-acetyltransferase AlgX-related protein, partial [Bryobacteraceae bacterium]
YEPNRVVEIERSYGDLAALGNLRRFRQYRRDKVSSDRFGYRNPPGIEGRAHAILLGDSFALGMGVSDEDTLAAQLGRSTGRAIYNQASHQPLRSLDSVVRMAESLRMTRGTVIWEFAERVEPPVLDGRRDPLPFPCAWFGAGWDARCAGVRTISPLRILAQRGYKRIQDDDWLPNPYAGGVVCETLRNGDTMLFYPGEVRSFHTRRTPRGEVWIEAASELRRHGLDLIVVLLPVKYTVYYPLLRTPGPAEADPNPYFAGLERQLTAAGIRVVNPTGALRREAAAALDRGEYLYWRDDTHWNAAGVRVAAREIARAL